MRDAVFIRIIFDVIDDRIQFVLVAYDPVVKAGLPGERDAPQMCEFRDGGFEL